MDEVPEDQRTERARRRGGHHLGARIFRTRPYVAPEEFPELGEVRYKGHEDVKPFRETPKARPAKMKPLCD